MRSILRSTCALFGVACALCSVAVASASANEFHVEGKAIASTVEGTLTSGASELKGEFVGGGTELAIKSQKATGIFALKPGGLSTATIDLEGNALYQVGAGGDVLIPTCSVSTIAIVTKADLSTFAGKLADAFEPASGTIFADFSITGSECSLRKTENNLTGTVTGILPHGGVSEISHMVSFNPGEAK